MSWEKDLKANLRDLDVPEHGPGFWIELEQRLRQEQGVASHGRTPNRRWRKLIAMAAVLSAFALVLTVALPNSLTPIVLAYSYPQGTYTYEISYFSSTDTESVGEGSLVPGPGASTEGVAILNYTVEENPSEGTKTIGVRADGTVVNNLDGTNEVAVDLLFVLDGDGDLIRILEGGGDAGFPAFLLPEPLPGLSRYSGLPFGFGPPFPSHPLGVGDSWTTSGPRSVFAQDGPQVNAEHLVIRTEIVAERDTLVIRSVYTTPETQVDHSGEELVTGSFYGPEKVEVTVWFDPVAGIIVRAELDGAWASGTTFENGQVFVSNHSTRTVIQLVGG